MSNNIPICVDLDGTLIRSDLLFESVFALLRKNVFFIFLLPVWLLKGKAFLKDQIAQRVDLDASLLPYHDQFLDYLREQRNSGRRIILTTAANSRFAEQISSYLGLFDMVIASTLYTNMSGSVKLQELVKQFGEHGFDYAGNSMADLPIWRQSRDAILVNPERGVMDAAKEIVEFKLMFYNERHGLVLYLKALRIHQWLKNLLLFVPLVMAHKIFDWRTTIDCSIAFIAFGLCASSVYLLNDALDLQTDRKHLTKRYRPLAAGILPIKQIVFLIPGLLFAAFVITFSLSIHFAWALLFYYSLTLGYSIYFKDRYLVDVLVLAGLYTIRIIAGGIAINVELSFWLLAFSMFFFYSLALVKRYAELLSLQLKNNGGIRTRDYQSEDLEMLAQSGVASGFISVLVLALYINSTDVIRLYKRPEIIWLLCPLVLYWVNRVWLLARRNRMHEDPVVFAIGDRCSYFIGFLSAIVLWAAI